MEILVFRRDINQQKEYYILEASDLHADANDFDKATFFDDFDRIKDLNGEIVINGDIVSAILPGDIKRWSAGVQHDTQDAKLNQIVYCVFDILEPYTNHITAIGMGNHETAVLRHNSFDPIDMIITLLNERRKKDLPPIVHSGYQGIIRFVYSYGSNGHGRKYDIFYNHGQGGSAEQTLGILDLQRYASWVGTDMIWIGHKHKRLIAELDPIVSLSSKNNLDVRRRIGVITGCYSKQVKVTDTKKNGYTIDFGEERQRKLQAQRGVILKHTVNGEIKTEVLF